MSRPAATWFLVASFAASFAAGLAVGTAHKISCPAAPSPRHILDVIDTGNGSIACASDGRFLVRNIDTNVSFYEFGKAISEMCAVVP